MGDKFRQCIRLLFARNTPWRVRLPLLIGLLYLLVPVDIIPDYFLFWGLVDDVTIGSLLVALALRLLPKETPKTQ